MVNALDRKRGNGIVAPWVSIPDAPSGIGRTVSPAAGFRGRRHRTASVRTSPPRGQPDIPGEGRAAVTETPLEAVPGWSAEYVARLKGAWVTTAEQVVALSATEEGLRSLSEQLDVPVDEALQLVELARAHLSPARRAAVEQPVDTTEYGLGARHPREQDNT